MVLSHLMSWIGERIAAIYTLRALRSFSSWNLAFLQRVNSLFSSSSLSLFASLLFSSLSLLIFLYCAEIPSKPEALRPKFHEIFASLNTLLQIALGKDDIYREKNCVVEKANLTYLFLRNHCQFEEFWRTDLYRARAAPKTETVLRNRLVCVSGIAVTETFIIMTS